ncbi:MAG: holo-ACP synthase [Bacteroidota bacterium]|nr:holo-ACP synthase [Bacteroidota bacterium]
MIYGVGTDIIEVDRIRKFISKGDAFKQRVWTPAEIEYCDSHRDSAPFYAARFSAKEAFVKAMGTGFIKGIGFSQIEVYHDELNKPLIRLSGKAKEFAESRGITQIHLSISHVKDWANAVAVLEIQDKTKDPRPKTKIRLKS